jgi:hypothetical protein
MADATLPDNAVAGTPVAAVSVSMSDGSQFVGTLEVEPEDMVTMAGNNIVLARNLTSADGGTHTWTITATQDTAEMTLDAEIEIIPVPIAVNFDPDEATLPDNTVAGFHISEVSVDMSDGSDFEGSLRASPDTIVTMVGSSLRTARPLTPNDVGSHTWTVSTGEILLAGIRVEVEARQ